MKSLLPVLALLLASFTSLAQANVSFATYYDEQTPTSCNAFASTITVDNLVHKTVIGYPYFDGPSTNRYLNLRCLKDAVGNKGTEYQIVYDFKQGYEYEILVVFSSPTPWVNGTPSLGMGLNTAEKTHNTSTNCTGPQYLLSSYPFTAQAMPDGNLNSYFTGLLTQNYASLSVAAIPNSNNYLDDAIQIHEIHIYERCTETIGVPSGLSAAVSFQANSTYGYTLNFNTVTDAASYVVEWFDVTTNTLAATLPVTAPGYLYTGFIQDHCYKFRVAAKRICGYTGAFSDWSANLYPPIATCLYGPLPSTLTMVPGCGGGTCTYCTLNWPAVAGAIQYKIEFLAYSTSSGVIKRPVTVYSTTPSATATYGYTLTGSWAIHYRVAVDCGSGFGNYSDYSASFAIQ